MARAGRRHAHVSARTRCEAAQAELTDELGITVEGAAAASWAGLLAGPRARGPGARHRHRQQRLNRGSGGGEPAAWPPHAVPADRAGGLPRSIVPIALLSVAAAVPACAPVDAPRARGRDGHRDQARGARALDVGGGRARRAQPVVGHARGALAAAGLGSDCANPASPVATWRALEAVVVLVALAIAGARPQGDARVALRCAGRRGRWIRWAVIGFLVAGPVALLVGPYLARPFFGDVAYVIRARSARAGARCSRSRTASWRSSSTAAR